MSIADFAPRGKHVVIREQWPVACQHACSFQAASNLSHMPQEADAAGRHPFDDEDVAGLVEAGVVRVDELAGLPQRRVAAHREFAVAKHLLRPLGS